MPAAIAAFAANWRGNTPPSPGFAPCDSLISIARTFADAIDSQNFSIENLPSSVRQPK